MKSICVYCGSNPGKDREFIEAAQSLGQILAGKNITLVYGGGRVGLMGEVADATLEAGGKVNGVIPEFMAIKEIAHDQLTQLFVVDSMHTRKAKMVELAEGFIALPGGVGTMEELFEVWTWGQLGQHRYPFGLLNVNGYYDDLVSFLDKMTTKGFLAQIHRDALKVSDNIEDLLAQLEAFEAPEADVRLKTSQT